VMTANGSLVPLNVPATFLRATAYTENSTFMLLSTFYNLFVTKALRQEWLVVFKEMTMESMRIQSKIIPSAFRFRLYTNQRS
jgi:hypothetical protein